MATVRKFTETELLELYHIIGTQETEVKTTTGKTSDFLKPNRELSTLLTSKSITYFYDEFEGDHTWTYWQPDLKRALKMMF
jgi:enterochelin esterase-like enzyme